LFRRPTGGRLPSTKTAAGKALSVMCCLAVIAAVAAGIVLLIALTKENPVTNTTYSTTGKRKNYTTLF